MKDFCRVLSWIVLILGLIGAFLIANTYGVITKVSTSKWGNVSTETQRDWPLTIGIFIGTAISALVIFAILGALAEIIERLEPRKETNDEIKELENNKVPEESMKAKIERYDKYVAVVTVVIFVIISLIVFLT